MAPFRILLLLSLVAFSTCSEWHTDNFHDHDSNFLAEDETEEESSEAEPFHFTELETSPKKAAKKAVHAVASAHKSKDLHVDAKDLDKMLDHMQKDVEAKLRKENIAIPKLASTTKKTAFKAAHAATKAAHEAVTSKVSLDKHGNIVVPITINDKSAGHAHAHAHAHVTASHTAGHTTSHTTGKHATVKATHVKATTAEIKHLTKKAAAAGQVIMPKKQEKAKKMAEIHPPFVQYDANAKHGGKTGHTHTLSLSETFSVSASVSVSAHQHGAKASVETKPPGGAQVPPNSIVIPKDQVDAHDVYEAAPKEVTKEAAKAAQANAIVMAMKAKLAAEQLAAAEEKIKKLEAEKAKITAEKQHVKIKVEVAPAKKTEKEPVAIPKAELSLKPGSAKAVAAAKAAALAAHKTTAKTTAQKAAAAKKAAAASKAAHHKAAQHGHVGAAGVAGAAGVKGAATKGDTHPVIPIKVWNAANAKLTNDLSKDLKKNAGDCTLPSLVVIFVSVLALFANN